MYLPPRRRSRKEEAVLFLLTLVLPSPGAASESTQLHFSDFYQIMGQDDHRVYNARLREIIEWGLRNSRQHRPNNKGLIQRVAEDWALVPEPIRAGLQKANDNFAAANERRALELEASLNRTRARINQGLEKKGFLVAYFMYNR